MFSGWYFITKPMPFSESGFGTCAPPSVTIDSPTDNATFQLGNDVTISATATDMDGSIASVVMNVECGTSVCQVFSKLNKQVRK